MTLPKRFSCERAIASSFMEQNILAESIVNLEQLQMKKELLKRLIEELQTDTPYRITLTERIFSRVNGLEIFDGGALAKNASTLHMGTVKLILLTELTLEEELPDAKEGHHY